jgi:hypothetical protein
MDIKNFLVLGLIFLLGFLSASLINYNFLYGTETPLLKDFGVTTITTNQVPADFVHEDQIEIYPDKVVINVKNASISRYAATGSMKPVLDENSNGIRIVPSTENDIHVGDIISYQNGENLIIHRVVERGKDSNGTYFILKGDNNPVDDGGKVRFKDIKYKTIAMIW